MKIGMTLPVTEPGWTRETLIEWARRIDQGPYNSLALGERICFPNPELMTTLGACAVLTERVDLVTTVLILSMHNPVLAAKQLATVDVLSPVRGRLLPGGGYLSETPISVVAKTQLLLPIRSGRRLRTSSALRISTRSLRWPSNEGLCTELVFRSTRRLLGRGSAQPR